MNDRGLVPLIAVACVAFGLGWIAATYPVDPGASDAYVTRGDPRHSFEEILAIEDGRERTRLLVAFFDRSDPALAPDLRDVLTDLTSDANVDETVEALFAEWWASADPTAAFHSAVNPRWKDRHPWMREVMRVWTREDPITAAASVLELPRGPIQGRLEAARSVVDAWLELEEMPDPTPLLLVLRELEPIARGGALQHVVATLVERRGIDATLDFVRGLSSDPATDGPNEVTTELLSRTAVVLLDHDPALAVAQAAEHAETPYGTGVYKHLAYYWGIRDGAAAMEWALSLPDDGKRPMILKRAWLSFGRKQTEAARAWLHERVPSESLRGIYREHLRALGSTEPELAFEVADRAENEALRLELRAAVARGWMKSDPDAASEWLAGAALPPELEARVLKAAPRVAPRIAATAPDSSAIPEVGFLRASGSGILDRAGRPEARPAPRPGRGTRSRWSARTCLRIVRRDPYRPTDGDEVDLIVVGSGAGAICAGLAAQALGQSVLIVEKQAKVGGSTAISGGVLWVPDNPLMAEEGLADDYARARTYFDAAVTYDAPCTSPARREAFLKVAPPMVSFLRDRGMRFFRPEGWSDYYDDLPGGEPRSRCLMAPLYDARALGDWAPRLARSPVGAGMPVHSHELTPLYLVRRTWAGKRMALVLAARMLRARLTGADLVTNGAALQGRLLEIGLRAGIPIATECPVTDLVLEANQVVGVRIERPGEEAIVLRARKGVLLNAGGFSRSDDLRERIGPRPADERMDRGQSRRHGRGPRAGDGPRRRDRQSRRVLVGGDVARTRRALARRNTHARRADRALDASSRPRLPYSILVDPTGERYCNESASYMELGERMYERTRRGRRRSRAGRSSTDSIASAIRGARPCPARRRDAWLETRAT